MFIMRAENWTDTHYGVCNILNENDQWQLCVCLHRHCCVRAPAHDQGWVWFHFCWEINNLWRQTAYTVCYLCLMTVQQVTDNHRRKYKNAWRLKWVVCFSFRLLTLCTLSRRALLMSLVTPVPFPLCQVKNSAVRKALVIFKWGLPPL